MELSINSNNGFDFSSIGLQPPGSEGSAFNNLVVGRNGVPVGAISPEGAQTVAAFLGYSDKDTVGSALDEVNNYIVMLNIAYTSGSADDALGHYINTVDPSQPNVPPIQAYINISDKNLQAGQIGGFDFSLITLDAGADPTAVIEAAGGDTDSTNNITDRNNAPAAAANSSSNASRTRTAADVLGDMTDELDQDLQTLRDMGSAQEDNINDARNNNATTTNHAFTLGKTHGGNPWLAGNVYVLFLMEFMELQRIMMKNKVVEGQVELQSMDLVTEIAKTTADLIMSIAKQNQMIHIVTAVMSAVSIVMTVVGFAMSFKGAKLEGGGGWIERGGMISGLGQSMEKLGTAATQAATDLVIAEKEGRKEILQSYRQIAASQMEKAADAFKQSSEAIQKALDTLDKIRDGLQQAVAGSLRR